MARFRTLADYGAGLDPTLLPPVRLLLVTLLCDRQWRDYAAIRETLGLAPGALSSQLGHLRTRGYLETRPASDTRHTWWRLTATGLDNLDAHTAALREVVDVCTELVRSARNTTAIVDRAHRGYTHELSRHTDRLSGCGH
jgi:DNA-binding MarR family transcriptional regulator